MMYEFELGLFSLWSFATLHHNAILSSSLNFLKIVFNLPTACGKLPSQCASLSASGNTGLMKTPSLLKYVAS